MPDTPDHPDHYDDADFPRLPRGCWVWPLLVLLVFLIRCGLPSLALQ